MSQHPSLRSSDKGKAHRTVLKRYERVKILKDKELWKGEDSVFGLQKVKVIKFKVKKEKAAVAETPAEGEIAAAPATGAAPGAAPAKGASPAAKAAPAKVAGKPQAEAKKQEKK